MPYLSKIYGAISTTVAKQAVISGRSAWIDVGAGSVQIYDGRPKLVSGIVGAYGDGKTTLAWTNESQVADYIRVERKTGSGGTWGLLTDTLSVASVEYEDEIITAGTYYYRVMPRNQWGYVTDGVTEVLITVQEFKLTPTTVAFDLNDLAGTTLNTTLSSPTSWTRSNISYGAGPSGWFTTSPNSGNSTTGATITITAAVDITSAWSGTATYTDSNGNSIVLTVAVFEPD